MAGTPLLECVFALPLFSPSPTDRSIRSIRFPEILPVLPPTPLPCFYPHFFYEKVVKVKADVAAILNFFSRSIPQIEADHLDAASVARIGGMRKGGFSGAL